MPDSKIVPNRIAELADKMGITAAEMSDRIGISVNTLNKYRQGTRTPNMGDVRKIAEFFDVSMDYLYYHDSPSETTCNTDEERELIEIFRNLNPTGKNLLLGSARALPLRYSGEGRGTSSIHLA